MCALRQEGGFLNLPDYSLVEIKGADSARFLQARLSNDVLSLKPGQGQMSALLDRKAYLLAYLSLHRLDDDHFIMLMETTQTAAVMEQLETYHFQEKVQYRVLDYKLWTIQGGAAPLLSPALEELGIQASNDTLIIARSLSGDPGFIFAFPESTARTSIKELVQEAERIGLEATSPEDLRIAAVEAGLPVWGTDMDGQFSLPETGLENIAASYNKGCYQGQEVLARIRTYGAPRRGLVGLTWDAGAGNGNATQLPPLNSEINFEGNVVGTLKSCVHSALLNQNIALAYVQRELRVPDRKLLLTIAGKELTAKVVALPFYNREERRKRSRQLYDEALTEFTSGSEDKAIIQLREVLKLDPLFADGYEALGVALSRKEQFDEAIELMKQLAHLNPESIMAHANLSVFYMQQGNKEAAEEEKALAMSIRMSQVAREFSAKQSEEAELRKRKEEAEHRMSMFKQVLEIDEEDFLANSGMGSAYVDLEQYNEAIPYLKRALATRPNHTVAYVSLAQAYEKLGQTNDAIATYQQGIAVAAQRGDLTPMKDMQAQLARLGSSSTQ